MKKIVLIVLLFSKLYVFSQAKYSFDYFTVYEYKKDSLDKNLDKDIYYSNSKDNNYLLSILMKKDTVFSATLIDYSKELMFIYKDGTYKNNINDIKLFKQCDVKKYNLEYCKNSKKSFYEINYDTIAANKIININRYKNSKKKKIINQSFYQTIPTKISDSQHYNFGILFGPLWCNKFTLNNKELIINSYFIEEGKKIHFRKLLSIEKTDFILTVSKENNKI
jgi:hypothetical protein